MRPVDARYNITQGFGSLPTRNVVGNMQGSQVQVLVAMYGDYQPDGHAGTDVGCPVGTPVRAARSGTVIWCNWDVNLPGGDWWGPGGYFDRWGFYKKFGGRLLLVQHAPGDIDVYAHLSAWKVRQGQFVNEGDLIALSGDSSAGLDGQLGPHLHSERIINTTDYPTGGGLIYGRTDPTTVWGGLAAQGTITTISEEEDDLTQAADDIARIKQILEAQENDRIRERIVAIDDRTATASTRYLKGDQEATLYEFTGGKLRGINLTEWQATGQGYRTLPQDIINALPKEG